MLPPLHLSLFGGFLLVSGKTPVTTITLPRVQSLLAYLVLHRSAPQDRSHLAFLLWPDSTEAQAHTNLRQLLYHLRQSLPYANHLVFANKQSLHWHPVPEVAFSLDVEEFEQALGRAEQADQIQNLAGVRQALEQAIHLYRGDLFPSCYEEWIFPERDRLHQLFLQAAQRLLEILEQERDYTAAINVAGHLLRQDPLHEATYRQLIRLHAITGDRAAALRTYHSCASLLERELRIMPSETTRQMYERLVQKDTETSSVSDPPTQQRTAPLIGRLLQWQHLQAAWRQAVAGRPHLVLLCGEAGIGKTRLAEEMEAWISRQGMVTASARCYAAEGRLPYAPVTTWLRTEAIFASLLMLDPIFLTEIARLLPEIGAKRPDVPHPTELMQEWQRQRFFEALARALLSASQPLLLLLDDLHWCDIETLQWVHYLFRFAPQAQLLIVGTVRMEEMLPGHFLVESLRDWQPEAQVRELTLEPLTPFETITLAEQVAGHPLEETLGNTLYAETEGNPLFVVEMVRSGTLHELRQKLLNTSQPRPLLTQAFPRLPLAVHHVIITRLAQLSQEARELASLAAVIGREFSFTVLSRASGEQEETLVRSLDELWQRRIVREQGINAYDFSHEKLREMAYTSLSATRRRLLHRQVAQALEAVYAGDLDTVSPHIAAHYEQAGNSGQAIPYYLRTAVVAGCCCAHEEALTALQRAIALLASSSPTHSEQPWQMITAVYEEQGDILELIGKHREAEQAYQQARNAVPEQEVLTHARLCRKIAATLDYPPHLTDSDRFYREAEHLLERTERQEEPEWREEWMQTHLGRLQVFFLLGAWQEMTHIIEKMQPRLQEYGSATQQARFFAHVAMRDAVRDHYVVAEATLSSCQMGLSASLQTGNLHLIGATRFVLGYCLFLAGRFDQAEEELQAALSAGEQVGDAELVARCRLHFLPLVWRRRGKVEAVRNVIGEAMAQGEQRYTSVIAAQRAWVCWRDNKQEEAETASRVAVEAWQHQQPVYPFQWTGLWPLIVLAVNSGQFAQAVNYVRLLLAPTQQRQSEALLTVLEEVLQAWDGGHPERVRALFQHAISFAQDMGYL